MDGQLRIDSLFAFTQIDTDGTEGVIGMHFGSEGWMPLSSIALEPVGSTVYAVARNMDTDVTGPLVAVEEGITIRWSELDPDGAVEAKQ